MKLLRSLAVLLGLCAPAMAQTLNVPQASTTINPYNGSELVRLVTQSGSVGQITINHLRNTSGYLIVPGGGTVNSTPNWYQANVVATGAITTWNVTLPNPAADGEVFSVANGTAASLTAVSVATGAGSQTQTLPVAYSGQTLAATSRAIWLYNQTALTPPTGVWYRIQ